MNLTYKLIENGYQIYLDGNVWISQGNKWGNFFPCRVNNEDGTINLAASAEAHIAEIESANAAAQQAESEEQERLKAIEANTTYLVMMSE